MTAPGGPGAPSPVRGARPVDHLLAEVRGLDRDMMVFLITWLSAAHPATAIAGLDAMRQQRDQADRAAAGLAAARPVRWTDLGSGPGIEVLT